MGTRGFVGFVVDGIEKITYNHFDSYPAGLGLDVLRWVRQIDGDDVWRQARALRVVDPNSTPSAEDVERLRRYADTSLGSQRIDDWYCLLRETQGDPAAMLAAGVIVDASDFPLDSLYAEWGYLVDLDTGTFEAYQGFQTAPHERGRFADRPPHKPPHRTAHEYFPVARVRAWPLDRLPSDADFLGALNQDDVS